MLSNSGIFGEYCLERYVYGSREGQKATFIPLDTRLQLPESNYSYLLQDWSQMFAIENPYGKVNKNLEKIFSLSTPVDSLERINRNMAEHVDEFRENRPFRMQEEGEILVASADAKGVPISPDFAKDNLIKRLQ